jgi:hypothetical protein
MLKNFRNSKRYFKCKICKRECFDLNNKKNRKVCSNDCRSKIPHKKTPEQRLAFSVLAKERGFGKWMKGRKPSVEITQKISDSLIEFYKKKGYADKSLWESSRKGYFYIHKWLIRKFGKAKKCDYCGTKKGKIEWAKIHHKKYERKKSNFWKLCRSCHIRYDRHNEKYGIRFNHM